MPVCGDCYVSVGSTDSLYLHYKIVHLKEKSDNFKCGEKNCNRIFSNWHQFTKHVHKKHNLHFDIGGKNCIASSLSDKIQQCQQDPSQSSENEFFCDSSNLSDTKSEFMKYSTSFVAKLYSHRQIPRNFVQTIVDDTSELLSDLTFSIKPNIFDILKNANVDKETISAVEQQLDLLPNLFDSLTSEHLRMKVLMSSGCFIKSVDHKIGSRVDDLLKQGHIIKQIVPVHAKFLPLRLVLEKVFRLPGVLSKTKLYMKQLNDETEVLENFVQGELWRSKVKTYFQGKFVIPLFIYFDDFEVNNPLGSHAGIQKLGAVYYSIPCFPPDVSSLVENIFTALLFHASDRVEYGNSNVFNILIDDLNFLQHKRLLIDTENSKERIFFSLGLVCGDNLGLNSILGFNEGFNSNYYCRLCKTSKLQARIDFDERNFREVTYESDIANVNSKESGLKEESVWNKVDYFDTSKNYFTDWLHEGPEGTAGFDMALILHHYVTHKNVENRVSLTVLNDRLRSFNYKDNAIKNVPPLILQTEVQEKKLKMTASEMQNFVLIFGMLVGDLVPRDEVWQFYLILREIVDIVLSRRLQKSCGKLLSNLVKEHQSLFNKLFLSDNLKPKGHLWVHYGTCFEKSGPIINMSTSRFESSHREKKIDANATCSRKNITHTLCLKEQLCLCYRFLTKRGLVPNTSDGPFECLNDISECYNYSLFKDTLPESFIGPCLSLNWAQVNGQLYKPNICVIIRLEEYMGEILPLFGSINTIIKNNAGDVCLVCNVIRTNGFECDLHAYDVHETSEVYCVLVHDLHSPFPVIICKWGNGSMLATLRHKL